MPDTKHPDRWLELRRCSAGYEIVVDAYTSDERAMGWYYYLKGNLRFPFAATRIKRRATSPFKN